MKARGIITIALATILTLGQMAKAEDPVYFADANLKQAVMQALGLTSDPTPSDMLRLESLQASSRGITNLTGLEYALNLGWLILDRNQITDISALSGLTRLDTLILYQNQISDISPLTGLTSLRILLLSTNQISDVTPLSALASLYRLELASNRISDISALSSLVTVGFLSLAGNQITSISALSNLTQLDELRLSSNRISDISALAGRRGMHILYLDNNQISDITPLSDFIGVGDLRLHMNQISNINALSGKSLYTLYLNNNQISDISPLSVSDANGPTDLRLQANQISNIDALANMGNLRTLYLNNNQISDISPLATSIRLTDLRLQANQISSIDALAHMTSLRYLYLNDNQISDISVLAGKASLQYLYLYNNQISSISALAAMVGLRDLRLNDNQISDISVLAGKAGLQYLYLHNNQISSIGALAGMANLRDLRLTNNQINDITVLSGMPYLTTLKLDLNQITDAGPLAGLTALRSLTLTYNQIPDMSPLAGLTALTSLDLGVNPITTVPPLPNLRNLTSVGLYSCAITSIDGLADLVNLQAVNLYNNSITDISALSGLTQLKTLYLGWNQISDISPLAGLTSLELLDLRRNPFPNLLPIAGLTNLRSLALDECGLQDVSVMAGFPLLSSLGLYGNQISDISPLVTLTHLTQLNLRSNPLNTDACTTYIPEIIANNPGIQLLENVCFEPGENMLTNGGFESGALAPWVAYAIAPAAASAQVVHELTGATVPEGPIEGSSCLHIAVAATGANFWAIGLQYPGLAFRAGKRYTLSAFLKSKQGPLQINFKPEHAGDPWTGYGEQVLTMTDTWARYSVTTPVFTEDVWLAEVTFHVGFSVGEFWMDDVRLIEEDGPLPQIVSFADPNLKQAVKDALGITTDPTDAQMAALTELHAQNRGITDLTGIQYAGNLTLLAANGNPISNISPLITLTTLQEIDLTGCPLSWESYCQWLPTIQANNPGLTNLQVDPSPYNCDCLPEPTPEGSAVSVVPTDNTTGTAPVVLTFEQVDTPGGTTLVTSTSGPEPQPGFQLGEPATYYDISTTASHSGLIDVCVSYAGVSFQGPPEALRLFHYEDGQWVDCTTMVDTQNQTICGTVTSLSPFAIMVPPTAIQADFNGTSIPAGRTIWFNSVITPHGLPGTAVTLQFTNGKIDSADGSISVRMPDATLTFDPAATCAETHFINGQWVTRVPASGLSGNTWLSGVGLLSPGLPGGIKDVTWSGSFLCDTPGVTLQWKWAAAVYTSFPGDPESLGVKSVDGNRDCSYSNSDHAGTPETTKSSVTGGARGGGGSNYTGGYSGTLAVTPSVGN